MIRINLLPIRAAQKRIGAKNELLAAAAGFGLLFLVLWIWYLSLASQGSDLEGKIADVRNQIATLKKDVVRIDEFKAQMKTLEQKIAVIDQLQRQRLGPARMLDDLARILTERRKVWLTAIGEKSGLLVLEGGAIEHEDISDFQLDLGRPPSIFSDIQLDYANAEQKGGVEYLRWKMTCKADYSAG